MTFSFRHSRVARKVLLMFLVSALLPILGISIYALRDLTRVVDQQLETELGNTARSVGQGLMERLDLAAARLRDTIEPRPDSMFTAIASGPIAGPAAAGSMAVRMRADATGTHHAMLHHQTATGLIEAELNPRFLTAISTMLPPGTLLCVLTMENAPIFCSNDQAERAVVGQLRLDGESGALRTELDGEQHMVAHWKLFLKANYQAPSWRIVVLRSRSEALAEFGFLKVFPLFAILALGLTTILSLTQIRRGMRPLQSLTEATERLARQDFSTPVEIQSRDEFENLGHSFNTMSSRLQQQFGRLQMFSQLDRRILSSGTLDEAGDWMLGQLDQLVDFSSAALVVERPEGGSLLHLIDRGADSTEQPQRVPESLPKWLASSEQTGLQQLPVEQAVGVHLDAVSRRPGNNFVTVAPIVQGDEVLGVLVVGFELSSKQLAAAEIISELRDRLAVAISSARREEALFDQAHYDQLTRLPNRFLFMDRLEQELARANHRDSQLAVLFLDLDRFKTINDSMGHSQGDELLTRVAARLRGCLRKSDTAARLGGDEFTILQPDLRTEHDPSVLAERVATSLADPFEIAGQQIYVTSSIGIAVYPNDGDTVELLLRNADAAMYQAKEQGGARKAYYSQQLSARAQERLDVETRLRDAVHQGTFELHYQPQYATKTGQLVGAEALIRLPDCDDPSRMVGPAQFIPIAEQSGLISKIGIWTLETACRLLADLTRQGMKLPKLSVNVSPIQLRDPHFAARIKRLAREHEVELTQLAIEITETAFATDLELTRKTLSALAAAGCQIALDDFGTGHSSLSYLQQFPIDIIKIDRSFVMRALTSDSDRALIAAIISLAQELGKPVIAEGVETAEQLELLRKLGCEMVQGYLKSKPLSEQQFRQLLRADLPRPALVRA